MNLRIWIKVLLIILLYGNPQNAVIQAFWNTCDLLLKYLSFLPPQGLRLVPWGSVPYAEKSIFSGKNRTKQVFVVVQPSDDINRIAGILAQNRPVAPIRDLIERHVASSGFVIPLTEFLPEFAKKKNNQFSKCSGSNCWNAVLNWHNTSIGEQYTSTFEIEEALRGPDTKYRKLRQGEHLLYGDVLVIRKGRDKRIYHAAIILDNNLVWHKGSPNDPWTFELLDTALSYYLAEGDPNLIYVEFFRFMVPSP